MGGRGLQSDTHLVCSVVSITWFLVRTIKFLVPLLVPTTALRLFRFFPLAPSTSSLHHKKDDCFRRWGARCMDFSSCCFHIRARRGVADRRSCTITKPLVNNSSDSNTVGSIIRVIFTLIFLFMLLLVARLLCETFLCTWIEDLKWPVWIVSPFAESDVGLSRGRRSKVTKYGNRFWRNRVLEIMSLLSFSYMYWFVPRKAWSTRHKSSVIANMTKVRRPKYDQRSLTWPVP